MSAIYRGRAPRRRNPIPGARRARGYALFVGITFLVIISLMALYTARQGTMLNHVAANQRGLSLAETGANAALRRAERWLFEFHAHANGLSLIGDSAASMGVYSLDAARSNADVGMFMQPERWVTAGARLLNPTIANFVDGLSATARLEEQPVYIVEDLGRLRPPGAGGVNEGGATGGSGYEGSGGMSPAGNSDIRIYRITGKSTGPNLRSVKTVQSVYAGRTKG